MVMMIFLALLFSNLEASDVQVFSKIEDFQKAGQEIRGIVTVEHPLEQKVDPSSFFLADQPLNVTLDRSFQISPPDPLTLSIYSFKLPSKEEGLYLLGQVSVKVDGKIYRSIPVSYTVEAAGKAAQATTEPFLKLEPFIDQKLPLYPGQKARVGYRYFFNYSVDLKEEVVPLLKADGFKKIGEAQLESREINGMNAVEASQTVEAIKPGRYVFGPSTVKGVPYIQDSSGQKKMLNSVVESTVKEFVIDVKPFPESGKPPSFKGAIGDFQFSLQLVSPNQVVAGDKITLLATIEGRGDLENVNLLPLCCFPGLSGFFEQSTLPPIVKQTKGKKEILIELRPLTPLIKEIPSIEFSFFNPETNQYQVKKSAPIPLTVLPDASSREVMIPAAKEEIDYKAKPVDIGKNEPLSKEALETSWFGKFWSLLLIPFSLLAIFLLKNYLEWEKVHKVVLTSEDLFRALSKMNPGSPEFQLLVEKALQVRLKEKGESDQDRERVERLLLKIEKARFGKNEDFPSWEEIKNVFWGIGG